MREVIWTMHDDAQR